MTTTTPQDPLRKLLLDHVADWREAARIRDAQDGEDFNTVEARLSLAGSHGYARGMLRAAEIVEECLRASPAPTPPAQTDAQREFVANLTAFLDAPEIAREAAIDAVGRDRWEAFVRRVLAATGRPAPQGDPRALPEADLDVLERLAKEATPGPWVAASETRGAIEAPADHDLQVASADGRTRQGRDANRALIVAARNALPALIAELRSLRAPAVRSEPEDMIAQEEIAAAVKRFGGLRNLARFGLTAPTPTVHTNLVPAVRSEGALRRTVGAYLAEQFSDEFDDFGERTGGEICHLCGGGHPCTDPKCWAFRLRAALSAPPEGEPATRKDDP